MKTITTLTAICTFLFSGLVQAQTDSSLEKKQTVINSKKIKVTINTHQKKDEEHSEIIINGDTMVMDDNDTIIYNKVVNKENTNKPSSNDNDRNPTNWLNCDFGFNFLVSNGKLDMPENYKDLELENGKGCDFNLRVYEQSLGIVKDRVYLVYGVGFNWNNYRFKNNIDLFKDSTPLAYAKSEKGYKKNKLVATYLTVPLMIKVKLFRDKNGESFDVALGPQFGYLLSSHTRQKWEGHKEKVYGDYNLAEFRIGYAAYIGYKSINLYVRYFPDSAFKKDKGPDANTVSMGLALTDLIN